LGTNNCRLLVARPTHGGFRVVDAFSRIVRLGEGLSQTGRLSEAAIARTLDALKVCRDKMRARGVTRARLIATEACRSAENGRDFLAQVRERLGMQLEIVDRETEAFLAAAGCGELADEEAEATVLFDIGGGSSEIVWMSRGRSGASTATRVEDWESLRLGVVSLAETFGGDEVTPEIFSAMTRHVDQALAPFAARVADHKRCDRFHLLGTSGTVTTIAGVHLNLPRYDRRTIDGLWLSRSQVDAAVGRLRGMSYADRVANGCIGAERADLVLAGCAILEAIRARFPAERIRIADRGLREGILSQMMRADRVGPHGVPRSGA
jgi:exopolyphosphatase/guanosine-5'-triphosphate,3'-diphosphate pyrophosphatase